MTVKEFFEGIDLENRTNINCNSSIVFNEYYNFCHITELPINANSFSLFIKDVINNREFQNKKDFKELTFYTEKKTSIDKSRLIFDLNIHGVLFIILKYDTRNNTYNILDYFIQSVEQYIKDNEAIRQKNL